MSVAATITTSDHEFVWAQTAFDLDKHKLLTYVCIDCGERIKELESSLEPVLRQHICRAASASA